MDVVVAEREYQVTQIRVAPEAYDLASDKAKDLNVGGLSKAISVIVHDALELGVIPQEDEVQRYGSRRLAKNMRLVRETWQDDAGNYFPGYDKPQSPARINMIVWALNKFAAGEVKVMILSTLRRRGEGSD